MKTVIVYESMFGSTRELAESIATGMRPGADVVVVNVNHVETGTIMEADLIIVGAPTHVHGLSLPVSRKVANEWAQDSSNGLELEADAEGLGVREWLSALPPMSCRFASFDTRSDIPKLLSGSASSSIERSLRRHGLRAIVESESFLVSKSNRLVPAELDRARAWGLHIARSAVAAH